MNRNVGTTDSRVRIGLGAVAGLVSLAVLSDAIPLSPFFAPVLGLGAVILLVTGLTGFCGLYSMLGVDTCPVDSR